MRESCRTNNLSCKSISAFILLLVAMSCKTYNKEFYISECNSNKTYTYVDLKDLIKNTDKYENQLIETVGYFSWDMEELAVYQNSTISESYKSENLNALWLTSGKGCTLLSQNNNANFFTSNEILQRVTGHKIRIKGVIQATRHGHMGLYNGTISDISLIEVTN